MLREAEETLALNKRISSNAIQKALLDAGNGDSVSSLNTLKKAISLIQQGKFGTDPRNAVIIESLQVIYCLLFIVLYFIMVVYSRGKLFSCQFDWQKFLYNSRGLDVISLLVKYYVPLAHINKVIKHIKFKSAVNLQSF